MAAFRVEPLIDWFVPRELRADRDARRRARLFVMGHLFGAPVGGVLIAYIGAVDPAAGLRLWLLTGGMAAFLLYPAMLRVTGRYDLLALASMEHLTLMILFGAYHYGGAASPFLPWLVLIPIVTLLHFGQRLAARALVLGALAVQLVGFFLIGALGPGFPARIPAGSLTAAGLFSVFAALAYATIMALYYTETIAGQQAELQHEVDSHRETAQKLRDARDAAERANRAKSQFLANMSHELRTPLNAIIGFSEIIGAELLGPVGTSQYAAYCKDIARSGRHLLKMIGEILDLARIGSGSFVLGENEFELVVLVEMTARQLRPSAERRGATIGVSAPTGPVHMRGDEPRVKQIVMNLMSNAVKFTGQGGSIRAMVAHEPHRGIIIKIADTGIGIASTDIHRVMLPFEQGGDAMARSTGGAGLGLPLARELVVRHGGTLTLQSEPGKGTIATVTFPHERALAAPPDAPRPELSGPEATHPEIHQYPLKSA